MHITDQKKEYAAVDIFKLFCAILVVAIHTKPFADNFWLDAGVGLITRFAVPYFFTSSAYFLFKKLSLCKCFRERLDIFTAYILRLIRFYAVWFVIFNVVDILSGAIVHTPFWYIKQFIFTTNGSPLWFLSALIWSTLIVFVLSEFLGSYIVFGISISFWMLGYMLTTLLSITENFDLVIFINRYITPIIGTQNGLYFAFPYIALASIMSKQALQKQHKKNVCFSILFFILLAVESIVAVVLLKAPLTFIWLSALPMTYFIMKLTLTIEIKSSPAFFYIRKVSTLIYVLHCIIISILTYLFRISHFDNIDSQNIILFITTVVLSFVFSYLIVKASKNKHFNFLKFLM